MLSCGSLLSIPRQSIAHSIYSNNEQKPEHVLVTFHAPRHVMPFEPYVHEHVLRTKHSVGDRSTLEEFATSGMR